jgi:hypothetical protein
MKTNLSKFLNNMIACLAIILLSNFSANALDTLTLPSNGSYVSYNTMMPYFYSPYSSGGCIYLASELTFGEEVEIHSVSLWIGYKYTSYTTICEDFSIWMRHTDATMYNSAPVEIDTISAGWVKVYATDEYDPVEEEGDWRTFEFDTPFMYDGVSNIEFQIVNNDGRYTGKPYHGYRYYSASRRGYYLYWGSLTGPVYSYTNSCAFNIQFHYEKVNMAYLRTEVTTPEENIVRLSDTRYAILNSNIVTIRSRKPLEVSAMTVNPSAITPTDVYINNISIYYTSGSDAFSDGAGLLCGRYNNPILDRNTTVSFSQKVFLSEGNNYFWIVYDIDPHVTDCNTLLNGNFVSSVVARKTQTPKEEDVDITGNIPIYYTPIQLLNPQTELRLCSTDPYKSIKASYTGIATEFTWEVWDDENKEWTLMEHERLDSIAITPDDVLAGKDLYRISLLPPPGNCSEIQQYEVLLEVDMNLEWAKAYIDNKPVNTDTLYEFCVGETMIINAEVEGDLKEVIWQYSRDNRYWFDISVLDMPTANSLEFEYIASLKYDDCKIRMQASSQDACLTTIYTEPISVYVYRDAEFTLQPPETMELCLGENFYTALNFAGEDPIYQRWYKDGKPLTSDDEDIDSLYTIQELEFASVTADDAGQYYYKIIANSCEGIRTMYSDTLTLYILPETEVITLTKGNIRANEGETAIFEVVASYAPISKDYPNGHFQWYRFNTITQQSEKLYNSYKIKGADASVLVINHITDADYTFNGDYYYCEVQGRCGNTAVRSEQILLIPAADLKVIKQPEDVVLCPSDGSANLSLQVFSSESDTKLRYQWYYDGTELVDNVQYQGSKTAELTVAIDNTTNLTEKFYCSIWIEGNDPTTTAITSNEVTITVLEDYTPEITTPKFNGETFTYTVGNEIVLKIETANPQTDVINWAKYNDITTKYDYLNIVGNEFKIDEAQLYHKGKYAIYISNDCSTTLVDEFIIEVEEKEEVHTGIKEVANDYISLSPNPTSNSLVIKYQSNLAENVTIDLCDMRGSIISTTNVAATNGMNEFTMNLSNLKLNSGNYFVRIVSSKNISIKSFVFSK